jgi:hypothetical protein
LYRDPQVLNGPVSSRTSISPSRLAIIVLASAAAAWAAYRVYDRAQLSPFVMGTVRAGMAFSVVEKEAKQEMGHGFACQSLGGRIRLCELVSDGPIGVLKIVVDRAGRAALIQFLVSDTSPKWIEKAREQDAEWSLVHNSQPSHSEPAVSAKRWETDNRRWSAQLSRHDGSNLPFEMLVTDANRLGRIASANPSALLRLAKEGMVSEADLAAAEKYASAAMAKAADSLAAAGAVLARKASALPRCPSVKEGQIVQGDGLRNSMGAELSSVAEQIVARAFPGNRLVIGERATYLVDSLGAAEEIGLDPNAKSSDGKLYAFGVIFPQRAAVAQDAAKAFQTSVQCRAAGEIIVAHIDPVSRVVGEFHRVDVDEESLMSVVGSLEFQTSPAGRPVLLATYLATYGGADWWGQLHWNELIVADPLTVLRRAPSNYGKSDAFGVMTEGVLFANGGSGNDLYNLSLEPGPSAQLSVLNLSNPVGRVRHVLLLAGPTGLASGWTLLSQL